jgi:hypothetical protein
MAVPILLYRSEIGTLRNKDQNDLHQSRWNFSEEQLGKPFLTTKGMKKFWKICQETKKIQIKLTTTCNKNEQQQDAKNNAES